MLSDKKEYILYGEIVNHKKYGVQFNVNSFDIVLPSKEEELITFLSSDLFPIGILEYVLFMMIILLV